MRMPVIHWENFIFTPRGFFEANFVRFFGIVLKATWNLESYYYEPVVERAEGVAFIKKLPRPIERIMNFIDSNGYS